MRKAAASIEALLSGWFFVVASVVGPFTRLGLVISIIPLAIIRHWLVLAAVIAAFGPQALWHHSWHPLWPWAVVVYVAAMTPFVISHYKRFPYD